MLKLHDSEKVWIARVVGFIVALGALLVAFHYMDDERQVLGTLAVTLIAWFVGKLTGEPLPSVTMQAIRSLPPKRAKEAVRILSQRPPVLVNTDWDEDGKTPIEIRKSRGPDSPLDS